MSIRLVMGGIMHESNTFSNAPTCLEDFQSQCLLFGPEVLQTLAGTGSVVGGFIDAAKERDVELIPTIRASATPMGMVTRETFDYLEGCLLQGIRGAQGYDGVMLELHGAMVVEGIEDGEGHILREVRRLVGPDIPIVGTLDLHANMTPEMVDNADVLIGYDTYPHVDQYERGREALGIMLRLLKEGLRPTSALAKPPLLTPLQGQVTLRANAMSKLIARVHKVETQPGVLTASAFGGFPFADIQAAGLGLLVVAEDDQSLAQKMARELAEYAWAIRKGFLVELVDPREAITIAMQAPSGTFILADVADTGAGGTAGDGTVVLQALLEMGAKKAALAQIADREAVDAAIACGVGSQITLLVGGKQDRLHGDPVEVSGVVRLISDGTYVRKGPQSPGVVEKMGRTVVLEIGGRDGIDLILTSQRAHPSDLEHFRSLGIEPSDKRILVLKSAAHYRAAFAPIATEIFEVDAPGICHPDLRRLPYRHIRRPIFPLDDLEEMGELS